MRNVLFAFALVCMAGSSAFAVTPSAPPTQFTIDIVSVIGSGCGTAADYSVSISPDKTAFTIGYANYAVFSGKYVDDNGIARVHSLADNRKNCQIIVRVNAPSGFTYGIAETDMRGYMSLRRHANPVAKTQFWFQGMSPTAVVTHVLRDSAIDFFGNPTSYPLGTDTVDFVNWQTTDVTPLIAVVYNPCGATRNLVANTQLQTNSDPTGQESIAGADATDGSIQTVFHFAWATCP
jgi:Domain of unknown function (DUF4360)